MRKHQIFLVSLLCFIAGVSVTSFVFVPKTVLIGGLVVGSAVMFYSLSVKNRVWVAGLFILTFVVGAWRFQIKSQIPQLPIATGERVEVTFTGIVSNYPDERLDKAYLVLDRLNFSHSIILKNARMRNLSLEAGIKIRITAPKYPQYRYGEKLLVRGGISQPENFADFDYKNYLAKDNIYLVSSFPEIQLLEHNQGNWLKQKLFVVREKFSEALRGAIQEPEAAFAEGLLLGVQARLPSEIQNNFRAVGLSHVVALSGFNITIIADALVGLFLVLTLKRETSFWLAIAGIICFVILTGAEASVVRAAVMGILVLIAKREGRLYSIKNALAFAAAVMIWFNPKVLRFDVGFQLSFLATLGLVYLAPRLETLLEKMPRLWSIKGYLVATLSAQFAVLPLILYQFQQFSTVAPLANVLVMPLIPAIMLISFIAALLYLILPILGNIAGFAAEILLSQPLRTSALLADWPLASFQLGFGLIFAIVYVVVLYLWLKIKPES